MTKVNCPICEEQDCLLTKENYYNYKLHFCNNCKGEFCIPFKTPSIEFYTNASDNESVRRHTVKSKWHITHPSRQSKLLSNGLGKSILDIGCGNGDFAEFVAEKNFKVTGIDIDEASIQNAKSRNLPNSEFIKSTLEDFCRNGLKFDIVSMFEVFEHVDNPKETIELIKKVLKPKGIFIGSLPSEERYFAKKLNLEFALPPYHLSYWTKETWQHYLEHIHSFKKLHAENNVYFGYLCNIM
jgi:2-polyprenyl-3-methyl-5-hydroxy-6-metoxy-1,4-benzoquinol methylase